LKGKAYTQFTTNIPSQHDLSEEALILMDPFSFSEVVEIQYFIRGNTLTLFFRFSFLSAAIEPDIPFRDRETRLRWCDWQYSYVASTPALRIPFPQIPASRRN